MFQGERIVATVCPSPIHDTATLCIDLIDFEVYQQIHHQDSFRLESEDRVLARANRLCPMAHHFKIHYDGKMLDLRPASQWGRAFILSEKGRRLTKVEPEHFWSRHARLELPDEYGMHVGIFMIWLVKLVWYRELASIKPAYSQQALNWARQLPTMVGMDYLFRGARLS
ncbi:MAG: hypothetical protein HJJLKODD_01697 [Phycisphaerae bacterium]|nr:hypothetical protein [Phycisphaerae bacterium]